MRRILLEKARPFNITKRQVWEAYKRVKANKGAAGIDGQSIAEFGDDLANNLYKIWNRLSSGSYFPPPVKRVEIPKGDGRMRPLGIPTVEDRIAQMVVKDYLEPLLDPYFHKDSYGYRPNKSALDAVDKARKRCWRYNWVLDLDIKGFFDNISHELLMRALRKHTDCRWVLLYIERWLKAPIAMLDGSLLYPKRGTPQGGVISPLLANLFLHYAFDYWMQRNYPHIPFERYADDIVCHCRGESEARRLKTYLEQRLGECGLELHPEKTKIVYCKDEDRKGDYPVIRFDFLGYTFRPRLSRNRWGKFFVNFSPAISNKAAKAIRQEVRNWRRQLRPGETLDDLARECNPKVRGWINYYGRFYPSALYRILEHIDWRLVRWATCKYKKLRGRQRRASRWLKSIARRQPNLFAHWCVLYRTAER
jgi:group II intron reverse transcriptase/maturase